MKELHKNIQLLIGNRLAEYGFKKKSRYVFVRKVNDSIVQRIGFNIRGHNHVCNLGPALSVRFPKAAALLEKLAVYYISSVGLNVGHLMPEISFKEWRFALDQDIVSNVDNMAETIIQYGIPFLNEFSDETSLIEVLDKSLYRIGFSTKSYLIPVFHFFRGEKELALQSLEQFIEEYRVSFIGYCGIIKVEHHLSDTKDEVDKDLLNYMVFVENFRKFLASS